MQILLSPSIAIYNSIFLAKFVFLAAADHTARDEWIPGSAGERLPTDSDGNNSLPTDTLSLNFAQTAVHHDFSLTKTDSDGEERALLNSDGPPVSKDFTKCHHRKELLSNYSNATSAFIECAVLNAKPILFCGQCVLEYNLTSKAWDDIDSDADCREDILVSDKLQIVSQTKAFLDQLWHHGDCQNCYDKKENFSPFNSTQVFLQNYNATMTCFLNNGGSSDMPIPEGQNVTLCSNCSKEYRELNDLYNGFSDDQLCMDIIDLMNRTRIEWRDSHCRQISKEYWATMALSVFICILPLFFYLTAMIHGKKKQQRLVERKYTIQQNNVTYSETCIQRPPEGDKKCGLYEQARSFAQRHKDKIPKLVHSELLSRISSDIHMERSLLVHQE